MFAVSPKLDCPHEKDIEWEKVKEKMTPETVFSPCVKCNDKSENWMCLSCNSILCSRFVSGHMAEHFEETQHPIAFSFTDASFWCYLCDSYLHSSNCAAVARAFQDAKFNQSTSSAGASCVDVEENGIPAELIAYVQSPKTFDRAAFVEGLKTKKFRKIAVLTGAGISVAAGIPDFRTPGTGLYSQVQKYGLPFPEAIFSLEYFRENPEPFFKLSKDFFSFQNYQPVTAHRFIKALHDQDMLLMNYTQNIDGLELSAGLPTSKLVQAHGHTRSARCIDCGKEYTMAEFQEYVVREEVMFCTSCREEYEETYKGLVKPDIVFFGERLPASFASAFHLINEADLVIVMGTALKVFPFAFLVHGIGTDVPFVLINRENPGIEERENFLFLQGDIQETLKRIAEEVQWDML
jgi:NAD-dependent SIR2 family protein deacetylase